MKFRDFSGGQKDSIDPIDVPANCGVSALNIDVNRVGCLRKAIGVELFSAWSPSEQIIALGSMVYNKVWDGSTEVNEKWELMVVQVADEHGLSWYEWHRKVDTDTWFISDKYYCGWDSNYDPYWQTGIEGQFGVTATGRGRFLARNNSLRMAGGAFKNVFGVCDSYPFLWRYVDRGVPPDKGDGYFRNHDSASVTFLKDGEYQSGIVRGRCMPNYTPQLDMVQSNAITGTYYFLCEKIQAAYYSEKTWSLQYQIAAIYDGYQVAPLKSESLKITVDKNASSPANWACKLTITVPETVGEGFPARLSGFKLYRSIRDAETSVPYSTYKEIANVDIQNGVEKVFTGTGRYFDATGDPLVNSHVIVCDLSVTDEPSLDASIFKDLYIKIWTGETTYKEYPVTLSWRYDVHWSGMTSAGWCHLIGFTPETGHGLVGDKAYHYEINSRWKKVSTNYELNFVDFNNEISPAPAYILPDKELEDLPVVTPHYTAITSLKDMVFTWGVIVDGVEYPNRLYYGYPANHQFAGEDILQRYLDPPMDGGDKIVGCFNYSDYLIVFTQRKAIRYLMTDDSVGEMVSEWYWDFGVESIDSVHEFDGTIYLYGNRGGYRSVWVWNPSGGKPVDLGADNRNVIGLMSEGALVRNDLAVGLISPFDKKYVLSVPRMLT